MYVLDTDHISIVQHRDDSLCELVMQRVIGIGESHVYATVVSFQEQALGWNSLLSRARTTRDVIRGYRRYETMLDFFAGAQMLSFDEAAAECFERIEAMKTRVGLMDLRIAAIVMANDMTLVTRNRVDFERIDGLRVEDWTRVRS